MAERRKIIIETGAAEPSDPLSTPHFDAEATLTARPVVPLTDQESHRTNYGGYGAPRAKPFWKRPALLIPVILAAVGVGIAAGFAIGLYRNRSAAQPPVVTAPTPTAENTDLSQTVEPPPAQEKESEPEARTPVTEETEETKEREETTVAPKEEERERSARNERKDEDDRDARQPVVVKPPPPVEREKKPIKVDEYEIEDERDARRAERERRREERRERRRRQREDEINVPRGVERGVKEVDRIREIFEGRQP